jgi:hypothetical protein
MMPAITCRLLPRRTPAGGTLAGHRKRVLPPKAVS